MEPSPSSSSDAAASAASEQAEYDSFILQQAQAVADEEAAALAEARVDNERKTRDSAFKGALVTIEAIITKAQNYSQRMLEGEGAKYTDEWLGLTEQPAAFSGGTLRDYQLDGFKWLARRAFLGESVILADEMGLGKTIQALAYIAWQHTNFKGPTLIICPLSTLGNWMDEIHRFIPGIPAVRYHGSTGARAELRAKYIPAEARTRHDVEMPLIVTTYDVAVKDVEYLSYIQWKCLAIDEGHKLKNEKGVMRKMLREYSRYAAASSAQQVKILLTGTPVQNDTLELWSLCNFIMPNVFSDRDQFKKIYTFMGLGTSVGADYLRSQEQQHAIISKLHALLERYMLRRTKAEVKLQLPPKVEALVYTPLTSEQVTLLKSIDTGDITSTLTAMGWTDLRDPTKAANVSTNNRTMNLRKICCHPYEFAEPAVGTSKARGAAGSAATSADLLGTSDTQTDERIITTCGKMVVLDKMLRKLRRDGHKVLIFSQFTSMLDILCDYFTFVGQKTLGNFRLLTGATPALERDAAIREFNADKDNSIFAFLLSTKAGGLGINLVAADTVIFYDSDWNPKQDDQAQDRAHRIGQVRPVVVYRLVTEGASVERKMMKVAAGKGALGRMVLQEGGHLMQSSAEYSTGKRKRAALLSPTASSTPALTSSRSAETEVTPFLNEETGASKYGKIDDRLLSYWLRVDDCTDASAGSSASSPLAIMRGIPDSELEAILDRPRALQAGRRVATAIEARLMGESTKSSDEDAAAFDDAVAGRHSGAASRAVSSAVASGGAARRLVLPLAASSQSANAAAATPRADADVWETSAAAAPFTPSQGLGYEFVYHEASRGLLPVQSSMDVSASPFAVLSVRAEISSAVADAQAAATKGCAAEEPGSARKAPRSAKPTHSGSASKLSTARSSTRLR